MPASYEISRSPRGMLAWAVVERILDRAKGYWIATTGPTGEPHLRQQWGAWVDGQLYFEGGAETRWARNLDRDTRMAASVQSGTTIVIIEGTVRSRVRPDRGLAKCDREGVRAQVRTDVLVPAEGRRLGRERPLRAQSRESARLGREARRRRASGPRRRSSQALLFQRAPVWSHNVVMTTRDGAPQRRPRLYVDVSASVATRVKQTADRFFRGVTNDAVLAALSAFHWMLEQKRQGRRVISVEADALPARYSEAVLPGVDEAMGNENWTWLMSQSHPWRRQLWIKGRRMTAGQLVGHLNGNAWTAEETARQFDLPTDAVLEAQRYVEANRELIAAEAIEEERAAKRIANVHPPEPVRAPPR